MALNDFNFPPFGNGTPRWFLGTSVPTSGTYAAGDIVFNSTPVGAFAMLICTVAGTPGTWVQVQPGNNAAGGTTSAALPTTGTYNVGDIVYNSAPTALAPSGWVNTVAGSPGTFLPFGQVNLLNSLTTTATSGTLTTGYAMILLNPASTGTYSLPNVTAFPAGASLFVKNIASGSTTLTPLGANGYDAAAITLAQNIAITLRSAGGTQWYKQA